MYYSSIVMTLFCVVFKLCSSHIEVVDSGMYELKRNNMALLFFVSLYNQDVVPHHVKVAPARCCEALPGGEVDCDSMWLQGGCVGLLPPEAMLNFTLIYPNMYGYNRKGVCLLEIWHATEGASPVKVESRLEFDTMIQPSSVSPVLKEFYNPKDFAPCVSTDLDPFNDCHPVNCQLKYSGRRNFFHRQMKRCLKTAVCAGDVRKKIPDIAYVPYSNTCRDLETVVTAKDVEALALGLQGEGASEGNQMTFNCHNGVFNESLGTCVCCKGWRSELLPPDAEPSCEVQHMCNIRCPGYGFEESNNALIEFFIGLIFAFLLIMCIVLCERYLMPRLMPRIDRHCDGEREVVIYFPADSSTMCRANTCKCNTDKR